MQNCILSGLIKSSVNPISRNIHLSNSQQYRQKKTFLQMYEWTLLKKKYLKRAKYPFIPREHPISVEVPISNGKTIFMEIPEMKPEYLVPPILNPNLKPYVSWTTKVIHQDKLEPESLFSLTYGSVIGKLHVDDLEKFIDKHTKQPLSDNEILKVTKMKN